MENKSKPYRFDDDMMTRFRRAERLIRQYDAAEGTDRQNEILSELFAKIGKNVLVLAGFHCEFGDDFRLGNNIVINYNCFLMDNADITVGDDVLIGPNVGIYTVNHAIFPEERVGGWCVNAPIKIGSRVWIGGNCTILPGVTIGDNSVIAAGAVVSKDVPANCVAAGVPAKVIKELKDDE